MSFETWGKPELPFSLASLESCDLGHVPTFLNLSSPIKWGYYYLIHSGFCVFLRKKKKNPKLPSNAYFMEVGNIKS